MVNRNLLIAVFLFTSALFLAGCMEGGDGDDETPLVRIVSPDENGFDPNPLTVTAGTTVMWRNVDSMPHTVTADDGSFDYNPIEAGETEEHTFDEPGEYPYHCEYHPGQEGTIIVEAAEEDDAEA